MLFETPFSAASVPTFPDRTLCLTFDDGPSDAGVSPNAPGPHSLELAEFLASEGVHATFFMVGRNLQLFPGLAAEIGELGHQVAAHTYDHVPLDDSLKAGGDVVRQMDSTAALMPNCVDVPIYLRAPYGQWTPEVAQKMNADFFTAMNYFGPIHWDNSNSSDWDNWQNGVDPQKVAQLYLNDLNAIGKGIILMHDNCADRLQLRKKNMGLALVRILVPLLKNAGFTMLRVDEIPGIASLAANSPGLALRGANQLYVSPQDGGGGQVIVSGPAASAWERLTAVPLGSNRYALRASAGQYLSVQASGDNPVTATGYEISDWETFEMIPWSPGAAVFRCYGGGYLTIGANGVLAGNGWPPTDANCAFLPYWYPAAAAAGGG